MARVQRGGCDSVSRPRTCAVLVALVLVGVWSSGIATSLGEEPLVLRSGTADRIVIDNPPALVSADEVVAFEAVIYDPVNNVLAGDVSWSASNGTITDDGLFFPWSAGLVEITAAHNGLTDRYNLSVQPGVPTQIDITRLTVGVLEPTSLTADVLDSRGNRMPGPSTMVWDIDGTYVGQGQPVWTADALGNVDARVRYNQLEARATVSFPPALRLRLNSTNPFSFGQAPFNPSRLVLLTSTGTRCRSQPWVHCRGLPRTVRSTLRVNTSPPTQGIGSSRCLQETSPAPLRSRSSPGTPWLQR